MFVPCSSAGHTVEVDPTVEVDTLNDKWVAAVTKITGDGASKRQRLRFRRRVDEDE